MEHKTWLWRRKSSEKTISVSAKSDLLFGGNEQQKDEAFELERSFKDLTDQLSSARTESDAKDGLLAKHAKVAEEAIAGWEKAEAEAELFKQELDAALLQKADTEERITNMDSALQESMQLLRAFKEEHQSIMNDAGMKIAREQEKTHALEKRLLETNNRLARLGTENSNLSRMLEAKESLIEDLSKSKSQSEANLTATVARLDSSEKENASLKYEVSMLQKEHEIRNQDRDFHLKSADAAHKQHLEGTKKIAKLELECQRLRVMVRKRLPGPAAIAKMRNEVEMLGSSAVETRRSRPDFISEGAVLRDFVSENYYDASSKKVAFLIDRLHAIEDENKTLKETLVRKNSELQSSRLMSARTASKLSQAETQLEEISKGHLCLELASHDLPLASISEDGGNDDIISCTESWASALLSELEHFRNGKPTTPSSRTEGISELSLMDDFIEMEKLAIVCVDKPSGSSDINSEGRIPEETESKFGASGSTGKELVAVDSLSDSSETKHEFQSSHFSLEKHPGWLRDILRVILQKHHTTHRSLDAILEEVSVALGKRHTSIKAITSDALSLDAMSVRQNETRKQLFQSNIEKSLPKLIETIDGIIQMSIATNNGQHILARNDESSAFEHISASPTGHVARVFLWEISELGAVLQHFIVVCNDLLHGKADIGKFINELASILDWIINHCFSLQDVSTMRETIKKLCDGNESHSENEFETGIGSLATEDGADSYEELKSKVQNSLPSSITQNGLYILSQMEEIESKLKEENRRLKCEIHKMACKKKNVEEKLESASTRNESLVTQLKESGESISNLRAELATLKDSKGLIEDQIENQNLISEDLDTQLMVAKAELNEARQNLSALEVELEDKNNCCEELEATCLELQLQLASVAEKEAPKNDKDQEEKQLRTDWEISAASEKLAECQTTILNLGKQLKAMAAPKDAPLFDKVICSPSTARANSHSQLLNQMQIEDEAGFENLKSPKIKEIICTEMKRPPLTATSENNPIAGLLYGRKFQANASHGIDNLIGGANQPSPVKFPGSSSKPEEPKKMKDETDDRRLVPVSKRPKRGVSLLRKLLSRRKKESDKKLALAIGS